MTGPAEEEPVLVSERTKQAGEVRARWAWTEPRVWTERMLTALETGVKGILPLYGWALFLSGCPCPCLSILSEVKPPTGEPYAGDPHVRFGGGGGRNQSAFPTSIIRIMMGATASRPYPIASSSEVVATLKYGANGSSPPRAD